MGIANLHRLPEFLEPDRLLDDRVPAYWYEGQSPQGDRVCLPRTALAEAIARGLMQRLSQDDRVDRAGKMYGVLLVETAAGERRFLQAFSGLWQGRSQVEGWVPPIPGRDRVAIEEAQTLAALATLKQELIALQQIPERQHHQALSQEFAQRLDQLAMAQRKSERQHQRQQILETLEGESLAIALEQLDQQSRQAGGDRRRLKQERDAALHPLKAAIDTADNRSRELKQTCKRLSQQLQTQLHAAYRLTNFAGQSIALQDLVRSGALPTGAGDCCAPKLLHFAATHHLKPLAMAEFWWGAASAKGDKVQGEFYPACEERCQPLMGFLLSGLTQSQTIARPDRPLPVLYEDEWLIAVHKPAGLLSVPGRYGDRQDSVLSRLRLQFHDLSIANNLTTVHRLDQETSGILLLAKDIDTHRHLSQQFQQRQVEKVYEAVLAGIVKDDRGVIHLSLWPDPDHRPYQKVDPLGKPSTTRFEVMSRAVDRTRVEFFPLTGRTHQLRVHAANPSGLGMPILGDRLYGCSATATRLHLHAKAIGFQHPHFGQTLQLHSETPF